MMKTPESNPDGRAGFTAYEGLQSGDTVRLGLHRGGTVEGKVVALEEDHLVLQKSHLDPEVEADMEEVPVVEVAVWVGQQEILYSDVESLEKHQVKWGPTVLAAAGVGIVLHWLVREGMSEEVPPLVELDWE